MDVHVIDRPRLLLAGFNFYGELWEDAARMSREAPIERLWARLIEYVHSRDMDPPEVGYEVHLEPLYPVGSDSYEVFTGYEIGSDGEAPIELVVKRLPASLYAKFELKREHMDAGRLAEVVGKWLKRSGYERALNYSIRIYPGRFEDSDLAVDTEIEVLVPVRPIPGLNKLAD